MPYYELANLVTVTKTNMIDEMPCGYGTLRNEHLEVLRSTGDSNHSVWQVCVWIPAQFTLCWCTHWTHFDVWPQLATTSQCLFTIEYWQSKKRQWNCDWQAICDALCGFCAWCIAICHWGVSEGSAGVRPLWCSHSAWMEMFSAEGKDETIIGEPLALVADVQT
jgi:hypothetical protein